MKRLVLVAWLCSALGCAGATSQVRRAAERGDVASALHLYDDYVEERGEGDPDLLSDVAMAALREAASSGDPRARSAGFSALRGLGSHARDVLVALSSRPGVVGDRAASVLFELDGRRGRVPPRLRAALRSDDSERRLAGLVMLRGARGLRRLVALSHDGDPQIRAAVVRELARRRGQADAARALVERVREDTDPSVRTAAVMALGAHGHEGVEALTAALSDRDPIVRMAAPSALMAAAPDEAATALEALLTPEVTNLSIEAARVLANRRDERAERYVLDALQHARAALRPQAAVAAQALSEAHGEALAPLLHDADPEVAIRIGAILARRERYREAAVAALRPIASRPDGFVAIRALGVLAGVNDPWAREPIRQALQSSDANVRRLAVIAWPQAIGSQGGDCDPLAPLLRDPDRSVALLAAMEIVLIAAR